MAKLESEIQKEITDYLESKGCYVIKVIRANKQGVADLTVCKDGKYYAIEVKAVGKKKNTTKWQEKHLDLVRKSGGKAFVADSVYDVIEQGL